MREILFRGKSKETGEWVEGQFYKRDYFYGDTYVKYYIITSKEDLSYDQTLEYYEVFPETVGQFTGLYDRNGKRIFEGDILDTPGWVVSYCADTGSGLGMNAGWYIQRNDFSSWNELTNSCRHIVLGNIHDMTR